MAEARIVLRVYLRNVGMDLDADFLQDGTALRVKLVMEMDVSEQVEAERYQ